MRPDWIEDDDQPIVSDARGSIYLIDIAGKVKYLVFRSDRSEIWTNTVALAEELLNGKRLRHVENDDADPKELYQLTLF